MGFLREEQGQFPLPRPSGFPPRNFLFHISTWVRPPTGFSTTSCTNWRILFEVSFCGSQFMSPHKLCRTPPPPHTHTHTSPRRQVGSQGMRSCANRESPWGLVDLRSLVPCVGLGELQTTRADTPKHEGLSRTRGSHHWDATVFMGELRSWFGSVLIDSNLLVGLVKVDPKAQVLNLSWWDADVSHQVDFQLLTTPEILSVVGSQQLWTAWTRP